MKNDYQRNRRGIVLALLLVVASLGLMIASAPQAAMRTPRNTPPTLSITAPANGAKFAAAFFALREGIQRGFTV